MRSAKEQTGDVADPSAAPKTDWEVMDEVQVNASLQPKRHGDGDHQADEPTTKVDSPGEHSQ